MPSDKALKSLVKPGRQRKRAGTITSREIPDAVRHNRPFWGHTSTGILEDGTYYVFSYQSLVYRLNVRHGAYSFDTVGKSTAARNLIERIREGKNLDATPIEKQIQQDVRHA